MITDLTSKAVVMVVASMQPLPFSTSVLVDMSLLFLDFIFFILVNVDHLCSIATQEQ